MKTHLFLSAVLGCMAIQQAFPAGRQLTGVYAPAATPALAPDEAQKKFTVPEGFEMRLFAAEPDVINPVAMTWDDRGRLWVVELYEYPLGAPAGAKPRDRVKILEDTDGDGRADKVTVFADGLNLATGIQLGNGGVYVGQAPYLLFFQDTDGDDVADKRTVLMSGFGLDDRHELLNDFTWGPDGWLYMTQGVFTKSEVKDPDNPNAPQVLMTAAVARFQPKTKKFEIFAEGTSNPWGVDFDRAGNAFVSACVIDHMFHMAAGGIYVRQAGNPPFPYAYELLPSIVDHKHFRAAYAGIQVYQGDQYPKEYSGTVFIGNIHDSAVHQDRLTPDGSSFKSSFIKDFVRSKDGWFRPVSSQVGPDGALWIMDWYDKYPCYQNANADPEGVDREHGRIWRVVYTGKTPGAPVSPRPANLNLGKLATPELVQVLAHPNVWHRRMAQRLLSERHDPQAKAPLLKLLKDGDKTEVRLAALWTLHGSGLLDDETLDTLTTDRDPAVAAWVARLTGERAEGSEKALERLRALAQHDNGSVRLAVATAVRQFVSGSLTIDTPVPPQLADVQVEDILASLVEHPGTANDRLLSFMIWMAAEPSIGRDPQPALDWLLEHGSETMPLSGKLARKVMRRICDSQSDSMFKAALSFAAAIPATESAFLASVLDGLIEGQKGKATASGKAGADLIAGLSSNPNNDVASKARELGTMWGDAGALQATLRVIQDHSAGTDQRLKAIQSVKQQKTDPVRETLLAAVNQSNPDQVVQESIRALSEIGGDTTGEQLLKQWKSLTPVTRRAAAEALASRRRWALPLLAEIEQKTISVSELGAPVIRSLLQSKDDYVRNRASAVIGKFRDSSGDKLKLIAEKRKVVLTGQVNLEAGHEVAKRTCFVCHKLYGEGADVGPDLTGVGRSSLEALLANVIDPNQIIGKGYENVEVETKDGRTVSGRVVENTDTRVRLLSAGPKEDIVAKSDIASMRVSELSVMPEGLEQMPDEDFRNLIWFILNPPQDKRPMTPELRKQLIGDEKTSSIEDAREFESIALWNPEWKVICPELDGAPERLPEFAGRPDVLATRPIDQFTGAALERTIEVPAGKKAALSFKVAASETGDWELRVLADGQLLKKMMVDGAGDRWKEIEVDLSPFAGKKTVVRLENCVGRSSSDYAYWSDLEIRLPAPRTVAAASHLEQ